MELAAFLQHVALNLRKARWAAGLTQEQVAERGISYKHLQEVEGGRREPTLRTLLLLAQVYGVEVADLVAYGGSGAEHGRPALADLDVAPPRRGRKRQQ